MRNKPIPEGYKMFVFAKAGCVYETYPETPVHKLRAPLTVPNNPMQREQERRPLIYRQVLLNAAGKDTPSCTFSTARFALGTTFPPASSVDFPRASAAPSENPAVIVTSVQRVADRHKLVWKLIAILQQNDRPPRRMWKENKERVTWGTKINTCGEFTCLISGDQEPYQAPFEMAEASGKKTGCGCLQALDMLLRYLDEGVIL
jgi:hypothetical protein